MAMISDLGPKQSYRTAIDYNDLKPSSTTVFPRGGDEDELGIKRCRIDSGNYKVYRFVEVDAASAAVANGTALVWADDEHTKVTTVNTGKRNQPAGVGIGTISVGNRGWVQTGGQHTAVITNGDDDIAVDDSIIMSTTDGKVDSVASGTAPTHAIFGVATDADVDAANTVEVFLTLDN